VIEGFSDDFLLIFSQQRALERLPPVVSTLPRLLDPFINRGYVELSAMLDQR
jgi:hypothetical protein